MSDIRIPALPLAANEVRRFTFPAEGLKPGQLVRLQVERTLDPGWDNVRIVAWVEPDGLHVELQELAGLPACLEAQRFTVEV